MLGAVFQPYGGYRSFPPVLCYRHRARALWAGDREMDSGTLSPPMIDKTTGRQYSMPIGFEWDNNKAASNIRDHAGVTFEQAATAFSDPFAVEWLDKRQDYGEERRLTLGRIEWRLYAVAYTMRGEIVRLISARKANQREQRRYYEALPPRP